MRGGERPPPPITLGTSTGTFFRRALTLPVEQARVHALVSGVSGVGKSRFLAHYYLSLLRRGIPATLIDPHADTARLVLAALAAAGVYHRPDAYERVIYLDLPAGERAGAFVPLNILAARGAPHAVASNVIEAMHRAWPALAGGHAPMFDTLVQDGCKVLVSAGEPITALFRFLSDRAWRTQLLAHEPDRDIVAFFRDQYDRLSPRDQADQAGAALRRAHLLTFAPVLKYSLGQRTLSLDFRRLLDHQQSLIVNLGLADAEARRLLGCLLTVAAEQGALSRSELPPAARHGAHVLIVDEFAEFTAQSEEAFARMLSQTRKFGLYLMGAHQTWSQASTRLRGALQNAGLHVVFRLGRADAELTAKLIGRVDPRTVSRRSDVDTEGVGMGEQWERVIQRIQDLPPQHAFIRTPAGGVTRVRTPHLPDPIVDPGHLAAIEARYLATYFRDRAAIEREMTPDQPSTPATRRIGALPTAPDDDTA